MNRHVVNAARANRAGGRRIMGRERRSTGGDRREGRAGVLECCASPFDKRAITAVVTDVRKPATRVGLAFAKAKQKRPLAASLPLLTRSGRLFAKWAYL